MRKILVTGAAGYIGSVLTRQLLERGYYVLGVDSLFFGGESLIGIYNNPKFEFIKGDLRNSVFTNKILNGITDVVHLAAIVGDPACSKQPTLAQEINWIASKNLFDFCNENEKINHFIFASTCSNYGKMKSGGYVTEDSELSPVSLYAELKVKFENYMLNENIRNNFYPTSLRFSTVYGLSSRIRFDLTVNEFIRDVTFGKELQIFGEQFWRPYCHVEDLAYSCIKVLESPIEKVKQNVFNVGATEENYQKKMIAEEILKIIPTAKITYIKKNEDPRDYRVDFSKIKNVLNFEISKKVPDGLKEINKILEDGLLSDPYSEKFKNI
ncbi:MAG: NAD(P)-dependent oxidoreductase [Ignavibacteriales bacterium]|jgi:nucleoside-diphosphate-sugar epimerase|nr:NAD(P)-dependent oxidoreductase [Ignavibacteriales bacterium]MBK7981500.1 NAD(P)-dependent oxidoreductase [Ignavibacteriota bacterium]